MSQINFVPHGNTGNQYGKRFKGIEKEGEKTCTKCKQSKLLDNYRTGICLDGKGSWCRECENKHMRVKYARITGRTIKELEVDKNNRLVKVVDGKKKCHTCKQLKLVGSFRKNINTGSGLGSNCVSCVNKYTKAYAVKDTKRVKLICMMGYGGCCQCCGYSLIEMLTI